MMCCCAAPESGQTIEPLVPISALPQDEEAPAKEEPKEEAPAKEEPKEELQAAKVEESPAVVAEGPVRELQCTIQRQPGSPWGATFEYAGPHLQLTGMQLEGMVATYNKSVDETARLRAEDLITEVNGKTEPLEMVAAFRDAAALSVALKVHRPERVIHQIARQQEGQTWGIHLKYEEKERVVRVQGISPDTVASAYNKDRELGGQLQGGDLIISCNGQGGSSKDILAVMRDKTVNTLELQVMRVGKVAEKEPPAGA